MSINYLFFITKMKIIHFQVEFKKIIHFTLILETIHDNFSTNTSGKPTKRAIKLSHLSREHLHSRAKLNVE